jgi:predicted DNA-binding transcriptional regulator AlpA
VSKPKPAKKPITQLDRRAKQIAADLKNDGDAADRLYTTKQLAGLLAVSDAWVEISRRNGEGPKWITLGPRCIRYRQSDLLAWLDTRATRMREAV